MAPPKLLRPTNPTPTTTIEWTLPAELLLEIVPRTDTVTLLRCAATCKLLRRDILHPSFVRHVSKEGGIVPPRLLLAYPHIHPTSNRDYNLWHDPPVTLVHPATPAASRFTDDHLVPFLSWRVSSLLRRYKPIMLRGSLVALRRRPSQRCCSDLCVYNLMTGDCAYLSNPPGLSKEWNDLTSVLLTAADGIGCSFMLLVVEVTLYSKGSGRGIRIQTAASSSNAGRPSWGPVSGLLPFWPLELCHDAAVVLHGGVIHWLLLKNERILTYDIRTERLGTVELPPGANETSQRILGTSPDGKLRFLVAGGPMVSVWLQLSGGWVLEASIDVEEKLRSLHPSYVLPNPLIIRLQRYGERSSVVLLRLYRYHRCLQHHRLALGL